MASVESGLFLVLRYDRPLDGIALKTSALALMAVTLFQKKANAQGLTQRGSRSPRSVCHGNGAYTR